MTIDYRNNISTRDNNSLVVHEDGRIIWNQCQYVPNNSETSIKIESGNSVYAETQIIPWIERIAVFINCILKYLGL